MTEPAVILLIVSYAVGSATLRFTSRGRRTLTTSIAYLALPFFAFSATLFLVATLLLLLRFATYARATTAQKRFIGEHLPQVGIIAAVLLITTGYPTSPIADLFTPEWQASLGTLELPALLYAAAVVIVATVGADFVATILNPEARPDNSTEVGAATARRGRTIGILERLVIVTLVVVDQWAGIAFVIAAKSLARFKEFDDRDFAEYYLIGTLTSALFAVAVGLAIRST